MNQVEVMTILSELIDRVSVDDFAPDDIKAESRFLEDLGFDSVKSIMLATLIESEFKLNLKQDMANLLKVKTVGDACHFVIANLPSKSKV